MKLLIEHLIKEVLWEESENILVPSSKEAWEKFESRLRECPQRNRLRFSYTAACLIAILLAITIFLSQPSSANAINNRILKTIVEVLNPHYGYGDINLSLNQSADRPFDSSAPPDWPLDTEEKVVTWERAQAESSFSIKKPIFMPKELQLDIITVLNDRVKQYYRSKNHTLIISQHYLPGEFASSSFFSSARAKKIKIHDIEATLINQPDPYNNKNKIYIIWFEDKVKYSIETTLRERVAIQIARSLK